ncbi:MAG TPA: glutamine--fructose-6-phosphate transaminase (isomerizing) [Candidatus Dormibacteraeota bacterium]|nr:glutamine--fructose-6-phosphate transaminase (isomerizing) [Candidatus Dormibacteraeota bacterium]
MCGIIGYLGEKDAAPIIIDTLKRLEYRGYDSAGVAVLEPDRARPAVVKTAGKVADLEKALAGRRPIHGGLGIGHTRWATHGKPTQTNAHPHWDCHQRIMVIHNGIIENYAELRRELKEQGHRFRTDTDTEVVPHLVESYYKGDLVEACRHAFARLRGAYSLVIFSRDDPGLLIGARLNAPLMVGLGKDEWFICSDLTGIIPYTKKALALGEGQMVAITKLGPVVTDLKGTAVQPKIIRVNWDVAQAQKGGYPHYMLKEINEDAEAVHNATRGHMDDEGTVTFPEFNLTDRQMLRFDRVVIVGAGSSLNAGMIGKYAIEDLARVPVEVEPASEFRYRHPMVDERMLLVALSQSGETADTLAAMREAKQRGATVVTVCNVVGSTMTMEADGVVYMQSGPEISVCSSKTFVGTTTVLMLLALRLAAVRHRVPPERLAELTRGLLQLPEAVEAALHRSRSIQKVARKYSAFSNFMYIGRGINHPMAFEGALKLKEISYLHAEGYAAGELKHGPIALLDEDFPVMAIATDANTFEKMVSNIQEVGARGAPVVALVNHADNRLKGLVQDFIEVPKVDEMFSPIVNAAALQLFAYYVAVERGTDVDMPRNLAKSVTVE